MFFMLCPGCGHQNKIKGFCTRCGLNLTRLPLPNVMNFNSVPTVELNQGHVSNLATRRLDAAQTQALMPRATMTERATTRLHDAIATTTKQTRPYVSFMLTATVLVFIAAIAVWRSVHVPTQNVAYAAVQSIPAYSFAPAVVPVATLAPVAPVSPWTVLEDQTQAVTDATAALSEDRQFATIEPNGQLALTLTDDQFFGNGAGADLLIHGASIQPTSYRVLVRDDANAAWQRIDVNRKGFAAGTAQHDMGHHGIARARQMMIRNDSASALQIDGIAANYPNLRAQKAIAQHAHRMRRR